jgi:hypothetical protein
LFHISLEINISEESQLRIVQVIISEKTDRERQRDRVKTIKNELRKSDFPAVPSFLRPTKGIAFSSIHLMREPELLRPLPG